jgi:hypothetical protein
MRARCHTAAGGYVDLVLEVAQLEVRKFGAGKRSRPFLRAETIGNDDQRGDGGERRNGTRDT